jgi:dTDP-4-dehydrorhamnose reductase
MKVLITGAGGQLGKALLASRPRDAQCIGLARAELDLTDHAALRRAVALHAPDLVINAAAYTAVDRAEMDPDRAYAVNAVAVGELSAAARGTGAHFVQISTDFVFDGDTSRAYRPEDARNPLSVYGRSKAEGEDAAGPAATIVRTAWVYGAEGANFVATMLRLMRERGEVLVVADQIGAPTCAQGLAAVVWKLGAARLAGIWHHTDAGVASWYDFAVAIAEEGSRLGLLPRRPIVSPAASLHYPTPARRPCFSLLDSAQTREALGMGAVHWRTNLRAMLEDVRASQDR